MPTRKNTTGPKTPEGKAKSALNAIKFGVSTFRAIDEEEKLLVEGFTKELLDYYEPKSPLEIMQLERIALCRAKLKRLYAVEQAKLQLVKDQIAFFPEKILDQLKVEAGIAKTLALEELQFNTMSFPFDLTMTQLIAIGQEVKRLHGTITSEKEFQKRLPQLSNFIKAYDFGEPSQESPFFNRLEIVLVEIKKIVAGEKPLLNAITNALVRIMNEQDQEKAAQKEAQDDADVRKLMAELDPHYQEEGKLDKPIQAVTAHQVMANLSVLILLLDATKRAQQLVAHVAQAKELILKSLLLPQAEADLLLRYQTTWERRLSTEVGEFLELKRHGHS
jgi:hypothetical protein